MSMKINRLEIENVKRIKAVKLEPVQNGLTIIGGDNQQGKTSVLDSIAWALGGERYKPSQSTREGSMVPPNLHIVMNNGLVVERKGKNSALKVTDPNGQKAGQQLLNEFVEQLALDLPRFMEASGTEKAKVLLQIIGVGPQLAELEQEEKELYQERLYVGRTADQKEKFAKEQPYYPDVPRDLVSPSELIRQQQEILAKNGENQRKRDQAAQLRDSVKRAHEEVIRLSELLEERKVYLTEGCVYHLKKYLESRTDDNPALFVRERKPYNRLGRQAIQDMLRKLGAEAGVHAHPHKFRRTFLTDAGARGVPLQEIQAYAGHAKSDTTMLYVSVKQDSIKASFMRLLA